MGVSSTLTLPFIALTCLAAWRFSLLSSSGAVAAFVVGCCVALGFGIKGLFLMGIFFISSSQLSKYKKQKKSAHEKLHEKGSTRDWVQVSANGGIAAVAGMITYIWPEPLLILVFAISVASATADTWASELGSLSKDPPISIKGLKRVTAGTSGAVSLAGTIAGFFGALLLAASAANLFHLELRPFLFILVFGFVGMLIDTVFGAFLQAEYSCRVCSLHLEKRKHCGEDALLVKGKTWLGNDEVNFISCLIAVILGIILYMVI